MMYFQVIHQKNLTRSKITLPRNLQQIGIFCSGSRRFSKLCAVVIRPRNAFEDIAENYKKRLEHTFWCSYDNIYIEYLRK